MSKKLKEAQPKADPHQVEILKNQFMKLAVIIGNNDVLIRILNELEQGLVAAIGPNGERDYSNHKVELRKNHV